jgi:alpha-N-arabinofuranosidase
LNLDQAWISGGIYAPTLRHHDGLFYLTTTNINDGGNFLVTARDPSGPWSDPVWISQPGIDPSLFWDDDGTCYYTQAVAKTDAAASPKV